ncbi:MAG: BACON domain-containing protein, partial [Ruminiclostridium sp.]|nr:BACON domain-containing protein [Ruminiclostridium sp.]MCF0173781.1 BACON domain-containing protein [Bacteroidales bacterium]
AEVSDEANWTITPANDGKSFTVAPKAKNKTEEVLSATVTVTSKELTKTVTCTQTGGLFIDGHEYVDLGLSVKWATCNVGAESETDCGQYFAWGETTEKEDYSWDNYKWGKFDDNDKTNYGMIKYNNTDGLTTLEAADDPATAAWGEKWRTPTIDQIEELLYNCDWTWETKKDSGGNDVKGCTFTSKINGNSIFMPAGGYRDGTELIDANYYMNVDGFYYWDGYYWSSSRYGDYVGRVSHIWLDFSTKILDVYSGPHYQGYSVRPVTK